MELKLELERSKDSPQYSTKVKLLAADRPRFKIRNRPICRYPQQWVLDAIAEICRQRDIRKPRMSKSEGMPWAGMPWVDIHDWMEKQTRGTLKRVRRKLRRRQEQWEAERG